MSKSIRITRAVIETIRAACVASYPSEACGILAGTFGNGGVIVTAYVIPNVAPVSRNRYELDPRQQMIAERAIAAEGLEVVGYFHSHPDAKPHPSETDRAAAWPVYWYLIQSVMNGAIGELAGWVLDEASSGFAPIKIDTVDI